MEGHGLRVVLLVQRSQDCEAGGRVEDAKANTDRGLSAIAMAAIQPEYANAANLLTGQVPWLLRSHRAR